ncbi:MAG: DUF1090 family protein [Variovorax sp.]|nr:MAG: DUF1090 family protein [Variovorax sp.]
MPLHPTTARLPWALSTPALLAVVLLLAATAAPAQPAPSAPPAPSADAATCRAEEAALIQDMDIARARGRMLQRRQLATELEAVQARCGTLPPMQSREAHIERLQSEIREMRKEIDRAETELRRLRQGL